MKNNWPVGGGCFCWVGLHWARFNVALDTF